MQQQIRCHRRHAADGGITPMSHGSSNCMAATKNLDQSTGYVGADCRPSGRVSSLLLAARSIPQVERLLLLRTTLRNRLLVPLPDCDV
eukprot:3123650-Prymnesium_polylepis.2